MANIAENTTAFTIQVEPKSREKVVTLFVSSRRKPHPNRKNKGSIFPGLRGEKTNIAMIEKQMREMQWAIE